jgi:hypothetical protein
MAGMKIVSFVDSEIVKARQVALRDLEELQRKLLGVTTRLAESMVALADRVAVLEQQGTGVGPS